MREIALYTPVSRVSRLALYIIHFWEIIEKSMEIWCFRKVGFPARSFYFSGITDTGIQGQGPKGQGPKGPKGQGPKGQGPKGQGPKFIHFRKCKKYACVYMDKRMRLHGQARAFTCTGAYAITEISKIQKNARRASARLAHFFLNSRNPPTPSLSACERSFIAWSCKIPNL